MAPYTYNWSRSHFQALSITPNFTESSDSTRTGKNESRGTRKKFGMAIAMRMHQIKIVYILVPNLEEIYLSGKKEH